MSRGVIDGRQRREVEGRRRQRERQHVTQAVRRRAKSARAWTYENADRRCEQALTEGEKGMEQPPRSGGRARPPNFVRVTSSLNHGIKNSFDPHQKYNPGRITDEAYIPGLQHAQSLLRESARADPLVAVARRGEKEARRERCTHVRSRTGRSRWQGVLWCIGSVEGCGVWRPCGAGGHRHGQGSPRSRRPHAIVGRLCSVIL